jgi:hypothetical protein
VSLKKQRSRFVSVAGALAIAGLCVGTAVTGRAALVGHWTFDNQNNPWEESSGFRPAGTHDGEPIGTPGGAGWSAEGHAGGLTGGSLDLTAGGCGMRVLNTSQAQDAGYQPTFDDVVANSVSIAFWAKGYPETWAPWVAKNGEGVGYQVRRAGSENFATFTVRGTAGEDDPFGGKVNSSGNSWHHYAAVWDGTSGIRQLYVDGVLSISMTDDIGPMSMANNLYLTFGARDWDGGSGGNFYAFTKCKLDDIRIYDSPLTAEEVQALAAQEAGTMILYPQYIDNFPGQKAKCSITLTPGALQTSGVTVWITNTSPAIVSLPGSVAGVLQLTFPKGTTNVQTFDVVSMAPGTATLTCSASDAALGNTATVQVETPLPPTLVAHWTFNDTANPYAETSGYRPAGTHDGEPVNTVTTSSEIPPGTSGYSLDLTQGSLRIANSRSSDANYASTFDDVLMSKMTIAFWVKIYQKVGNWGPFVNKDGESAGFQVRLADSTDQGCFTVRGTDSSGDDSGSVNINDGQWHHIAAVRDGLTGLRLLYVDGYPDQSTIRPLSDTGIMLLPGASSLFLGTGESGREFSGYLKDVRIYNYALTRAQVQNLMPSVPTPMVGHWTFDASAPWTDSSGYKPAGTHDLLPVGSPTFSTDVPPGRTGQSLDLTAVDSAVVVSNSNQRLGGSAGPEPYEANPTWEKTFDQGLSAQMSIAFWAKGFPDAWRPWVSKNGEGYGYQVRRNGGENSPTFTLCGTPGQDDPAGLANVNDNAWHHYAAVWDGIAGTRQLYVDGTLDPGVNLTGDYGPSSNIASWEYVVFGGRDAGGVGNFVPCLMNDVRIYRLALSQAEVLAMLPASQPPKLATSNTASGMRISWPVSTYGYALQTSASLAGSWSDAGLPVGVEGNERVAYAPVSASAQFFRLVK